MRISSRIFKNGKDCKVVIVCEKGCTAEGSSLSVLSGYR